MDFLDRDVLFALASHRAWPSVSVYLPTHRFTLDTNEDRIRLKNLLRECVEKLLADGMRQPEAEEFCSPIRALLDDHTFWRTVAEGLAIFVSVGRSDALRLDASLPEQTMVGDRFYLRPLLSAYRADESFYALSLDKNMTRLFRGDRAGIEEISLGDTPTSFAESMKYEEAQASLQHSSYGRPRVAQRTKGSEFHGHGGEKDVAKEQLERFARDIERGVTSRIKDEKTPLVLLGVDRVLFAYRGVNTYEHLADEQVLGASDYLTPQQVQSAALEALAPRFAQTVQADLSELTELEGTSLASHDPVEIVAAAATGRVKTLFLDESAGPYGVFDRETFQVTEMCATTPRYLRENREPAVTPDDKECGWDLADLAAAETALHGGEIRTFTGEETPISGLAAVYRY
jgi:hypothetical protein